MTSSKNFDSKNADSTKCKNCGSELSIRPKGKQPVVLQALFGINFIIFLVKFDAIHKNLTLMWTLTGIEVVLGVLLIFARNKARQTIFHCSRCSPSLG